MANTNLTISMITKEALRILKNNLKFAKHVNRQYDPQFARSGAKIGNTLNIRKPVRFTTRTGQSVSIQDATETQTTLTLDSQKGVDFQFSSQELTLDIDSFSERYIQPAVAQICNTIDYDGLQLYNQVYQEVGTPGTVPNTSLTYLQAMQYLMEEATPRDNMLTAVINPEMEATIVNALQGLFHQSDEIGKQYKDGSMGRAFGFKFEMDQNTPTHTKGTHSTGSTGVVNGASQSGNSLVTDGWANSTAILNKGDIITIANVNGVNPQSYQAWQRVRQFVVTEDVSSDGSGNATIPISPAITVAGPFQTVDALPADDAAITVQGTEAQADGMGIAFHRDAFCLGMADLEVPDGVDMAERASDEQLGLSIRVIRDYSVKDDLFITRLDVLYGWTVLYPQLACRIAA